MSTWLVTGASRGIGLELVRQLHARGDDVIATCRTRTPELDAVGCRVVDGIDVGSDDVGGALREALGHEQPVDVVVNNAGVARWDALETIDLDAAREEIEVTAAGLIRQIDALDVSRSGRFFHADGSEVAW